MSMMLDCALTYATFASFAFGGPGGLLIGGAFAVLGEVLRGNQKTQSTIPKVIEGINDIKKQITENDVVDIISSFETTSKWLSTYLDSKLKVPKDIKVYIDKNPEDSFTDFYKYLHDIVTNPEDVLRGKLQKLIDKFNLANKKGDGEKNFQVVALSPLTFCVGVYNELFVTYHNFLQFQAAYAEEVNNALDINKLKESIDYLEADFKDTLANCIAVADTAVLYIQQNIPKRFESISKCTTEDFEPESIFLGGYPVFYCIKDTFPGASDIGNNSSSNFDDGFNKFISEYSFQNEYFSNHNLAGMYSGQDERDKQFNNYIQVVCNAEHCKYEFSEKEKIKDIINHWKDLYRSLGGTDSLLLRPSNVDVDCSCK